MSHAFGMTVLLLILVAPLPIGLAGVIHGWRARSANPAAGPIALAATGWSWRLIFLSALLYVLAFNLTFFIQELFLVVPKAFTPGLRPTLFHNNHGWQGDNPLASLFQGTGALAIFTGGVICVLLLWRGVGRQSIALRLFLIWMAFNGLFQALPQVLAGAFHPGNDVGMAMDYLELSGTTKTVAALLAVAAIPLVAIWLAHRILDLAPGSSILRIATVPALIAIPVIIAFRVPRELTEVVLPPVLVTLIGVGWMQGCAWFLRRRDSRTATGGGEADRAVSLAWPLGATVALLLIFQLVLRPGIPFY